MTLLAPMLIVMFYSVIIYFALNKDIGSAQKKILVSDRSGYFVNKLHSDEMYSFVYDLFQPGDEMRLLKDKDFYAILDIPSASMDSITLISLEHPVS